MKQIRKHIVLYICILAMAGMLCGCGGASSAKTGESGGAAGEKPEAEKADSVTYEESYSVKLPGWLIHHAALNGTAFFGLPDVEPESGRQTLCYCNLSEKTSADITLSRIKDGTAAILLACLPDEKAVMAVNEGSKKYSLYGVDKSGAEFLYADLVMPEQASQETFPVKLLALPDSRLAVLWPRAVQLYGMDGRLEKETACEGTISTGAVTKDGNIVCGINSMQGCQGWFYDVKENRWTEKAGLDAETLLSDGDMADGDSYAFYYQGQEGIMGYDAEQKKSVLVLSRAASGLHEGNAELWVPFGEDCFVVSGNRDEEGIFCHVYVKLPEDALKEQKVITLATASVQPDLETMVADFNRTRKDYKIEIKDYNGQEGNTKLLLDLTTGNVPDIFDLSGLPVDQLKAVGLLENLAPYYEKDSQLSTDDILEPVRNVMSEDGGIYYVADGFTISTILARKRVIGDASGWTMEEFLSILNGKKEESRPFYINVKSEMFGYLITTAVEDYIDWESGEVRFDSDSFKALLAACNEGVTGNMESLFSGEYRETEMLKDGSVYTARLVLNSPDYVIAYSRLLDDDLEFVGYPCSDRKGSYFNFQNQFAMSAQSQNKEAAWEFLRTYMLQSHQSRITDYMPARRDCYEKLLEDRKKEWNGGIELGDFEVTFDRLTDKEVEQFNAIVNGTNKVFLSNGVVEDILREEAEVYFNGDRSLDDTVKIIQNRVQTYVSEQK